MTPVCTRHAEQGKKTDAGGNAEVRAGNKQGKQAADGSDGNVGHNQQRPLEGLEHGVEDDEDDEDRDGQDDEQARVGSLLARVFALPVEVIAVGQLAPAR